MLKIMKTKRHRKKSNSSRVDSLKPLWADDKYEKVIASLNIGADYKNWLKQILRYIKKIGERIVEFGKKIIEIIVWALKRFPRTVATGVVGAVLTLIASHIPLVGPLLAPFFAAMTIVVAGAVFIDEALRNHIFNTFSPLA